MDDFQKSINKMLGISDETWRRFGPERPGEMVMRVLKEISPDVLKEFQLLPYGKIDIEGDEPAYVDEESIRSILKYQERRGNDMVIDYEHQTLKDVQAPAAGWVKKIIDRGMAGIWAVVDWTNRASEYIANKEYRYFSPVILVRPSDRKVVAVANVALTNYPKINNLKPIVSKHEFGFRTSSDHIDHQQDIQKSINKMLGISDEVWNKYNPKK